jgi:large subunit ribosomal protein L9
MVVSNVGLIVGPVMPMEMETMALEVVLTKAVDELGNPGDVVRVSDGYARNCLFPRKLAQYASKGALKHQQEREETLKRQAQKRIAEDKALAATIEKISPIVVKASVGEEGKLFGTITPKELGRIISEKSGVEVDRRSLSVDRAMNRVGSYDVQYRISSLVDAKLVIDIQAAEVVAE